MGYKRRGGSRNTSMSIDDIVANDSLQVCVMGNLRGIKESRLIRDMEACDGYAGITKVKKAYSLNWGHLDFESKEQKEKTLRAVQHLVFKNKAICFSIKKEQQQEDSKKQRLNAEDIDIQDVVTPLWKMSYEAQLAHKARFINQSLFHVTKQTLKDSSQTVPEWIKKIPKKRGPCCEYDLKVVPSPVIYNYRNKSSFSAGLDINGEKMFGFSLGAVKDGIDCIGDPTPCCHISFRALEIRKIVQEHLAKSDLDVYKKDSHTGFWRRLTVRDFTTKEGLVIVEANTSDISEERLKKEKEDLVALFTANQVTESLCFLPNSGISNFADMDIPIECLSGVPYLHEKLFDLQFRVSPDAFFQVNTKGAEVLYDIIRDWCDINEQSTVLDLCCGTGSITLSLAKSIKNIIGVEMNAAAVEDAKRNAKLNNITNAKFIAGKAEDVVPSLLEKAQYKEFVAVVDPPRAGLHKSVIKAIRDCPAIKKIVFVSCDHTNGLIHNGSALCRATSNGSPGIPFRPAKVTAVDMFPHTDCVEVVMLFERDDPSVPEENAPDSTIAATSTKEAETTHLKSEEATITETLEAKDIPAKEEATETTVTVKEG